MTDVTEVPNLQLLNSRRALFPSAGDESDGDLGHIRPISTETDSDSDEHTNVDLRNVDDYLIINTINKQVLNDTNKCTPPNTKPHRNVHSPINIEFDVSLNDSTELIIPETPLKESPSDKLKTPHDTSSLNVKAPKLIRKTLLDNGLVNTENNKRKLSSPEESPVAKMSKLDGSLTKSSKVRTALFPDSSEKSIPTKTFYSHTNTDRLEPKRRSLSFVGGKTKQKSPEVYLCARNKRKSRYGLINAGVGHKIKKSHHRKIWRKPKETKTDLEIVNDSQMLDYLEELENLKNPIKQMNEITTETNVNNNNSNTSRKRESTPLPDEKRKFFKTAHSKSVLKDDQITSDVATNSTLNTYDFDTSDLSVPEDNPVDLNSILGVLEDDKENTIVLKAHNSISASENSILLHDVPTGKKADLILSPISQMCDTTSGLALSSPKGVKNLSNVLQSMPCSANVFNKADDAGQNNGKLFPIFYKKQTQVLEKKQHSNNIKRWKGLSMNQTLIDAGQKNFGATQCGECGLVYSRGEPNDEMNHQNYHESKNILRFNGWKNERVVTDLYTLGSRIIKVIPGDTKMWWKKVAELLKVVNRELGYFDMVVNLENTQVFLYIKNKSIIGCLVSEPGTLAHKMLTNTNGIDLCSEESYPIKCIVQRIWVTPKERKNGIATSLMNSLRRNFMMGYILNLDDIAFSSPTDSGKLFATRYFKTPNFLVYS